MIAFTDPLFLAVAVLIWAAGVGWAYAVTRLVVRRYGSIVAHSKSNWIVEQAITYYAIVGMIMWFVVAPFLLGVGEAVITLEGYVCLHVGLVFAFPAMGLAFEAEHVEPFKPEPKKDLEEYPW